MTTCVLWMALHELDHPLDGNKWVDINLLVWQTSFYVFTWRLCALIYGEDSPRRTCPVFFAVFFFEFVSFNHRQSRILLKVI